MLDLGTAASHIHSPAGPGRKPLILLILVTALLAVGLGLYSQTRAFHEDEGYHLQAAHLINRGATPYLDFVYPQPPLNPYLNAAWMRVFGESWRSSHMLSTLETAAAILLSAWFVLSRFPIREWRLPGAITVALLVGLNMLVVDFGTIGQAYGLCLLLTVAAFLIAVVSVNNRSLIVAGLAGLLAGAAAMASLLTAAAGWFLFIWILCYNRVGNRIAKICAFIFGAMVSLLPVFWLFAHGPRQVWFNLFQFHLFYRQVDWPGAVQHDIDTLTSWIDYAPDLLLILLALAGLLFLIKQQWWKTQRAEFVLCGGLALAMGFQNSFAHPTFRQYFVMMVPFLAILASLGLYAIALHAGFLAKPSRLVLGLALLLCLQLARSAYTAYEQKREDWHDYEAIARKVEEVTPPQGKLYADLEVIYFLTGREPPPGAELHDSWKVSLSPTLNALFHILPKAELDRQIRAGVFETIEMYDEATIDNLELENMYERRWDYPSEDDPVCSIFSGLKKGPPPGSEPEQ